MLRLSRSGIGFSIDPRIDSKDQRDDSLYQKNSLDRGHIARRADLCWGSRKEDTRANRDSFYFTNIAPQHLGFNQSSQGGLWGKLENAIFEEVRIENLKISVMGGCIFIEDDPEYRKTRIPREFWKILVHREDETNK
jgi:endonuclease G, mitochondrial